MVFSVGTAIPGLGLFLNLPCRDPHDMDRVADHVGGTL